MPLVIVGIGSEEKKLRKMARGNVKFAGLVRDCDLLDYYKNAKALIFPQEEDFGLVAVEAISSGTPVIAYKKGGAVDIVEEGVNGVFFRSQIPDSLSKAISVFEGLKFDSRIIVKNAKKFSEESFKKDFIKAIET